MAGIEVAVPSRPAKREALLVRLSENRHVLGMLMVAPAILLLAVFLAYPFGLGVWLSLTDATIGKAGQFVAVSNFVYLLRDSVFKLVIFNTALYAAVAVAFKLLLGCHIDEHKLRQGPR